MEIQGSQQKADVQEATQQAKAAVNAARDRVKENLEELQEIQQELQSAKDARAAGKDVNVAGLEKRISDIQVSMTASVEQAGREVSQATDKAKSTVAAKTGGHPFTEDATDTGAAQHAGGASSANPQEPDDEEGPEDEDLPTPNASQGINQGFFVRRSSSGRATPDVPDSEESADDAPVPYTAPGRGPQAAGGHTAAGADKGAHTGGERGGRRDGDDDVWSPNASQGINQGFFVRHSGSGEPADEGAEDEDEDWNGAEPVHPDIGMSDAAGQSVRPTDKGPSTQDVLASMDEANTGAADATRSNTATLEKLAASSGSTHK